MHGLDARRIDEDLEERVRQRQAFDLVAVEFEGHGAAPASVLALLEEIRAQHRVDEIEEARQDAVIVEARDLFHLLRDEGARRRLGLRAGLFLEVGIEARIEQGDERGGDERLALQRLRHVVLRVADRRLLQIAGERPHQRGVAPGEARLGDERVEIVALALAFPDARSARPRGEARAASASSSAPSARRMRILCRKVLLPPVGVMLKLDFVHHLEAEIFEDRHPPRERHGFSARVELQRGEMRIRLVGQRAARRAAPRRSGPR